MKLDFSKFKKLHEDTEHVTMQHPDGHQIKIAKKPLSGKMLKELQDIPVHKADGGQVELAKGNLDTTYNQAKQGMATQSDVSRKQDQSNRAIDFAARNAIALAARKKRPAMAEGGKVEDDESIDPRMMADGGDVDPSQVPNTPQDSPEAITQAAQEQPPQAAAPAAPVNPYADTYNKTYAMQRTMNPGEPDAMSRGTALRTATKQKDVDQIGQLNAQEDKQQAAMQIAQQSAQENQQRAALGMPPQPGTEQMTQAATTTGNQQDAGPANQPTQVTGQSSDQQGGGFTDNIKKAYGMEDQGIQNLANAEGALGSQKAGIFNQQAQSEANNLSQLQESQHKAMGEHENFVKDVQNGYIDPNRYIGSMGTGETIGTAIGLMLGGFGGGITHQGNPAMDFLNKQIDRDVNAQATNLNQKNNLLAHNIQMLNSVQDGYRLTQAQMNSMYSHKIDQAVAGNTNPIAQAQAQQARGQLLSKNAMLMGQIGGPGQGNGQDPMGSYLNTMRVINPERAKEIESRYIPGMGLASVPLSEEARQTLNSKQQLADASKDMYDWASKHSGSVDPRDINVGKTKAANLQNMYRGAMNGGVYKKGEQEFIDQIIDSDPSKFFNNIRVLPKLKEVMSQNQMSTNGLKRQYGFSGPTGGSQASSPSGNFQPKSFKPVK